jgi:hypothetical protein
MCACVPDPSFFLHPLQMVVILLYLILTNFVLLLSPMFWTHTHTNIVEIYRYITHQSITKSVEYHLALFLFLSCVIDSIDRNWCQCISSTLVMVVMSIFNLYCSNLLLSMTCVVSFSLFFCDYSTNTKSTITVCDRHPIILTYTNIRQTYFHYRWLPSLTFIHLSSLTQQQ